MSESNRIDFPLEPETPAQSAMRTAAILLAVLAFVGLIVWFATGGSATPSKWAASTVPDGSPAEPVVHEDASGIYVSPPPDAEPFESRLAAREPSQATPVRRNAAPPKVAALLLPARKPARVPATDRRLVPDEPTPALPATEATRPAKLPPEPPFAIRDSETLNERMTPEFMADEDMPDDFMSTESMRDESDEPSRDDWDEPSSYGDDADDYESFDTDD